MFRIAMKAPIIPARTAIHAVRLALSADPTEREPTGEEPGRAAVFA